MSGVPPDPPPFEPFEVLRSDRIYDSDWVGLRRDGTAVRTWRFRTVRLRHATRDDRGTRKYRKSQATAVGEFLRRTRTDTLPMLYNVAKGEFSMSEMMQHA